MEPLTRGSGDKGNEVPQFESMAEDDSIRTSECSVYQFNESMWEVSTVLGRAPIGSAAQGFLLVLWLINLALAWSGVPLWMEAGINGVAVIALVLLFRATAVKPVSEKLADMADVIRNIAEGGGNLRQRRGYRMRD